MNMLANLEKAIEELEIQKDEIFRKIQINGWEDDRSFKSIPEKKKVISHSIADLDPFGDTEIIIPERRPLPFDVGRIYQKWYGAVRVIIEKNQPARLDEFDEIYNYHGKKSEAQGKRIKQIIERKHIEKREQFLLFDLINRQFDILSAVPNHVRYSIYDIELTVYSVLMDDDISASRHLLSNGFLRPAGALAGVILERHIKNLLRKNSPPIKYKETDTLSKVNDLCKNSNIYDGIIWRKIQHLTDLRNLCDHSKDREPTKEDVNDLINGVSEILKTCN